MAGVVEADAVIGWRPIVGGLHQPSAFDIVGNHPFPQKGKARSRQRRLVDRLVDKAAFIKHEDTGDIDFQTLARFGKFPSVDTSTRHPRSDAAVGSKIMWGSRKWTVLEIGWRAHVLIFASPTVPLR